MINVSKNNRGTVLLALVDLVLKHFDIDSIGGAADVSDIISKIFSVNGVAEASFWTTFNFYSDEDQGLAGFVERQVRMLPQEYHVTFKMISALTTDPVGREKVIKLLNELLYVSEPITGRETEDEIETNQSGTLWTLRREKTVSGIYQIEPGATGEPMNSALGPIIQFWVDNLFWNEFSPHVRYLPLYFGAHFCLCLRV